MKRKALARSKDAIRESYRVILGAGIQHKGCQEAMVTLQTVKEKDSES
jgi:hypothetical protein